eukprot:CAMPEP_0115016324 /NCGR_PEP_ID=MMETSP0216-20121206/27359_1 /TAXON_ID=223996 /ORGANISM="Protocruzia adherens, Strain Boccale" /LENGTH=119 /DNA_ID=CAMNT_0002386739 /DNA_START=8 /DNA_END=367 /DNA_ORIENTATION=-
MSQYVRIKRLNQTYFIRCEPTDDVASLKSKLAVLTNQEPANVRLYLDIRLLEEHATLHDQQVTNDIVLRALYKKPAGVHGALEWEEFETHIKEEMDRIKSQSYKPNESVNFPQEDDQEN